MGGVFSTETPNERIPLIRKRAEHLMNEIIGQIQTDPLHERLEMLNREYMECVEELDARFIMENRGILLHTINAQIMNECSKEQRHDERIAYLKEWFDKLTVSR